MENIRPKLEELKNILAVSPKEKIVGVATTADINNPPIIFGSVRETNSTIAITIILRDVSCVDDIVSAFDGVADYFFIDSEIKNEADNLEAVLLSKIKKSKWLVYKPNDFTVDSLDMFVALLTGSLAGKKVFVVGAGNIGSKITLKLCERGAGVFLFDKDFVKTQKIIEGLNLIKRGKGSIFAVETFEAGAHDADIVIGATPGIPVINLDIAKMMKAGGKIIDAGNRTVMPETLAAARARGIEILSLSSLGGYTGMVENFLFQRNILNKPRVRTFQDFSLITPGTLGARGDILVDDVDLPTRIFGVCDGLGTLLPKDEGVVIIRDFVAKTPEISKIGELYH